MPFGKAAKNEAAFRTQIEHYSAPVIELCRYALASRDNREFPSRDFLSRLQRDATRLQELVDHHGAQHSELWFPFRESIAAAKLFSTVTYAVRHIRGSLNRYELMDVDSDCREKADAMLEALRAALVRISEGVLEQAERCGIDDVDSTVTFDPWVDAHFNYVLKSDRPVRHVEKIGEAVVHLSTKFLNLSEERDVREVLAGHPDADYAELVPEPINEERLRLVESRFHNLQSRYDTYILESDVEQQNSDLSYLRGHISIIYHLMEIATQLAHYYIRHMSSFRRDTGTEFRFPMSEEALLKMLFECPIRFSRLYLESAVQLCRKMIQSYAVQEEIEVPIPYYRGFHVRPSTLIARIVAHYGSTVTMRLNGHEYNAGLPLELFRANEEINAAKRRAIADVICDDPNLDRKIPDDPAERARELQLLLVKLMNDNKIVLYDTELDFESIDDVSESTIAELAVRVIRHLVSVAKMDIRSNITVKFAGDNRALHDLEILANNGYGEDQMGNNIVLPEDLTYLAR